MPWRLIRRNGPWPPAGYVFQDPRTGQKFNGLEANLKEQALRVIQHRFSNPQKYNPANQQFFDFEQVVLEIEAYTCLRLGNDKRWCHDTERQTRHNVEVPVDGSPTCPACGNLMVPKRCSTCSGVKYRGFRCPKCYSELNS